ncbi:MAG: P-II family nitrogen regulator [Syntrophomonadaceae bacterium]|jgi:nitrogen regulatory protein PII
MDKNSDKKEYVLICVIVKYGMGSKVIKMAKRTGVSGGTIFLGRGTAQSRLLRLLDLSDIRKEIAVMVTDKEKGYEALEIINKELQLSKPNHGIAYSIPVKAYLGTGDYSFKKTENGGGENKAVYHSIFIIVDKGKGDLVMDIATESGATGGTIINARGSGIHETHKLFNFDIEPEKEVVLILSKTDLTEQIATSIRDKLEINKPGNGIIFIQEVAKTYGIQ